MTLATPTACPQCGRDRLESDSLCSLCGHLFARTEETTPRPAPAPAPLPTAFPSPDPAPLEPRLLGLTEPWFYWQDNETVVFFWDERECSCEMSIYELGGSRAETPKESRFSTSRSTPYSP